MVCRVYQIPHVDIVGFCYYEVKKKHMQGVIQLPQDFWASRRNSNQNCVEKMNLRENSHDELPSSKTSGRKRLQNTALYKLNPNNFMHQPIMQQKIQKAKRRKQLFTERMDVFMELLMEVRNLRGSVESMQAAMIEIQKSACSNASHRQDPHSEVTVVSTEHASATEQKPTTFITYAEPELSGQPHPSFTNMAKQKVSEQSDNASSAKAKFSAGEYMVTKPVPVSSRNIIALNDALKLPSERKRIFDTSNCKRLALVGSKPTLKKYATVPSLHSCTAEVVKVKHFVSTPSISDVLKVEPLN